MKKNTLKNTIKENALSGGTFNYHESHIEGMANYVRRTYLKHKSKEWIEFVQTQKWKCFRPYSKETLAIFKKAYKVLRTAYIYAKCIDYLEAGDYGEEDFKEYLELKTGELNRELKKSIKASPDQVKTWIEDYDEDDYWY